MIAHPPVLGGTTDYTCHIRAISATDGTPQTLSHDTSGIALWYRRGATGAIVSLTEAALAAVTTAHTDGGVEPINQGYTRVDLPDAAVAAGVPYVTVGGTATGLVIIGAIIPIVAFNPADGVRLGLTALPNAAAEAAGGLYTRGSGAGQIVQPANGLINANVTQFGGTNGTFASGRPEVNASHLGGTSQTGRDVGASVLLSSGTGTGQLSLSSGAVLLQATQTGVTIPTVTTLTNAPADSSGVTTLLSGVSTLLSRLPDGLFTGITSLAEWLGLLAGKQSGNSTARTEIRATGAGSGTFDETTDSQEALRDRGDAAYTTATGFSTHSASDVWAVGSRTLTSISGLGIALASKLTRYVQLLARKDAAIATDAATELGEINADEGSGAGAYANTTDAQEAIRDRGDAEWVTGYGGGGGGATPEQIAAAVWDEDLSEHDEEGSARHTLGNVATGTPPTAEAIANEVQTRTIAAVTTVTNLTNAPTAGDLTATMKTSVEAAAAAALTAYDPPTRTEATSDKDDILTRIGVAGAGLTALGDTRIGHLDAAVSTRLASASYTAPPAAATNASAVRTELATELGRLDAAVSTRATQTSVDDIPTTTEFNARTLAAADYATAANQLTIAGYIDTEVAAIIDAIAALHNISTADVLAQVEAALTATVADAVPANGTRPSISSGVYMLVQFMAERAVAGTTATVRKPDGSTTLFALTLNDATSPTAVTRSS